MQQPINAQPWKFLFVNTKEEDTRFLTKNLPVEVIHTAQLDNVEHEIKRQPVNGIFVDLANASPEKLSKIKEGHDTAVVMLADVADLPRAIQHVKHGDAHGFVVKGVSDSDSVMKLVQFVSRRTEPSR